MIPFLPYRAFFYTILSKTVSVIRSTHSLLASIVELHRIVESLYCLRDFVSSAGTLNSPFLIPIQMGILIEMTYQQHNQNVDI